MHRYLIILCIALITISTAFSQPVTDNSFEQKLNAAQEAESQENFSGALEWYEKVYDEMKQASGRTSNPDVKKYALKIAELNYLERDYERAEKGFQRVLDKDEDHLFDEWRFLYGMCLKSNAKYSEALAEFNKVISLSEDETVIKKAEFEIKGIELLEGIEPNIETSIAVMDKSINSPSGEFSPRETSEGDFYYASYNRKTIIERGEDEDDEDRAKVYVASRNKEGKYEDGEALDQNVNRIGFDNAHVAFSRDGRTMYFTRMQMAGTQVTSSVIMVSYKKDTGWSAATAVPTINGDWFSKHPAIGQLFGKDVLFFVSDMKGGKGKLDIYYSNINSDGSFSSPVNLGDSINTEEDDVYPYYYEGTLYFSSLGRPTLGGLDIFYSIWDGTKWSNPQNMGLVYNSSYDDHGFSMATEGGRGYFLSNRPVKNKKKLKSETCCDDIFEFNIRTVVIDLLAVVVNEGDEPLNGATIKLENLTDPINFPTDIKFNSLGNEFQFLLDSDFKYRATISSSGYYPDSLEFNTAGIIDSYTIKKKISLKAKPIEEEVEVTETVGINEAVRLNNIYYDFDDDKILEESEKDLTFLYDLMNEHPSIVIELLSHTDSQGTGRYNIDLSQRRADSARSWLLNNGIKKNRIKAVGYGEKRILNHCKNGVQCSDDEHRLNRRTEFKILEGPETIEITRTVKRPVQK